MNRTPIRGAARAVTALVLALAGGLAAAHGDEPHGPSATPAAPAAAAPPAVAASGAATREAAQRLPDGTLFVPKHVQRVLAIRTQVVAVGELAASRELNGRVIADPGAGGRVQAMQAGSVLPAQRGFPQLGQRVRRGETIAWLRPAIDALERGDRAAQRFELDAQAAIAERRVARLEQLEGSVPAKEIDAARVELQALKQRRAALAASVDALQPLTAPIAGAIASVAVVAGEVVDARALLFEIVDPSRLAVEAIAYDPALAADIVGADGIVAGGDGAALRLAPAGAAAQLRGQALPLRFRIVESARPLAVGEPVRVVVRTRGGGRGVALPASALARDAAGRTIVWIHHDAERFEPRAVRHEPLDATRVAVREGLAAGERVVVDGAGLLSQVR